MTSTSRFSGMAMAVAAAAALSAVQISPRDKAFIRGERDLDEEDGEPMVRAIRQPLTAEERKAWGVTPFDALRSKRAQEKRERKAAKRLAIANR